MDAENDELQDVGLTNEDQNIDQKNLSEQLSPSANNEPIEIEKKENDFIESNIDNNNNDNALLNNDNLLNNNNDNIDINDDNNNPFNDNMNDMNNDISNNLANYKASNLYRPQRTESPRTLRILSTEERKGKIQKYTVYIIECDPPPTGVVTVARRYNDFKWLRNILLQQFPGCFVPPLPPGTVIGRFEDSFIKERKEDLERFLNRLEEIKAFAESMAFSMFLCRPESTLNDGKIEVQNQLVLSEDSQYLTLKNLFPDLDSNPLNEDVYTEDIPRLRQFLSKIEVQMNLLNKSAVKLFKHLNLVSTEMSHFHSAFDGLYAAESNYPYSASKQRLDVRCQFDQWSNFQTRQTDAYYSYFFKQLRYEHEDIQSLLELFKYFDVLEKKLKKIYNNINKWEKMASNHIELQPKHEKQKEIDYQNRDRYTKLLDLITKIILRNEIITIWNAKTLQWRDRIQTFAQMQNDITKKTLDGWKKVANQVQ